MKGQIQEQQVVLDDYFDAFKAAVLECLGTGEKETQDLSKRNSSPAYTEAINMMAELRKQITVDQLSRLDARIRKDIFIKYDLDIDLYNAVNNDVGNSSGVSDSDVQTITPLSLEQVSA